MAVAPSSVFFPNPGLQAMTAVILFSGMTIISHCISRRLQRETLTLHGIITMPWPRMAVILMFLDSWLFLFGSGILIFGIGLEFNTATCTTAAYLCVSFYSTSKFFVYAFLAEKAHIVWSPRQGERRLESSAYVVCLVSVSLYCIIMTLMLSAPVHEIRGNGACVIGLKPRGSIPLLTYDMYINLFLTSMFLYPLVSEKIENRAIKRLALRTCIAAFLALSISTANVVLLIVLKGRELAWVNLAFCSGDIICNAVAIFWVSGSKTPQHLSGSPAAEHHRRQQDPYDDDPVFITGGLESIHYNQGSKPPLQSLASPPILDETATAGSFPRYLEGNTDDLRPGHFPRPGKSWLGRLLFDHKSQKERPMKVTVTTEHDTPESQIELQARSDTNSEVLDDKSDIQ